MFEVAKHLEQEIADIRASHQHAIDSPMEVFTIPHMRKRIDQLRLVAAALRLLEPTTTGAHHHAHDKNPARALPSRRPR